MEKAFTEGVRPGGLTESYQVNILICYLLDSLNQPLSAQIIQEAAVGSQLVNYFELANALSSLLHLGNLTLAKAKDDIYSITASGREMAATFKNKLPLSVRDRVLAAAKEALAKKKKESQIIFNTEKTCDGYNMTISVKDIGTDLMSISVFLPTQESCETVKERFLKNSEEIYQNILILLTGENIG